MTLYIHPRAEGRFELRQFLQMLGPGSMLCNRRTRRGLSYIVIRRRA